MIDAPIVWLDDAGMHAEAPSAPVERALATWAGLRSFRVTAPGLGPSTSDAPLADPGVAQEIERALLRARESTARLDGDGTDRALAHAEGLLRQNPALPQGAWLLAEVRRAWAVRHLRIEPRDEARAERDWAAATALDGGRAAGLGEPARAGALAPPVDVTLDADGSAELLLDGVHASRGALKTAAGEHQLLAVDDGRIVWGAWITVDAGTIVRVGLPRPPSCSRGDFRVVALRNDDVVAGDVRCGTWIAGDARRKDVLRVAVCEAARCGTWIEVRPWDRDPTRTVPPPPVQHGFPAWATWTLVTAGALATTALVLWGAGVFDARPTVVQFTQGPVQPQSLH